MWTLAVNDLKCPQQNWGGRKENWGGLGPPGPSLEPRLTRIKRKFVIILSLKIPPHAKCVTVLPCEMSNVLKATTEKDDFRNNTF